MKLSWLLLFSFIVVCGCAIALHFYNQHQTEQRHERAEEMQIVITNLPGAKCELYKAGQKLPDARMIPLELQDAFWLSKGNYFLSAEQNGRRSYYPISVPGYPTGPDDGKFNITIRPYPSEFPGEDFVYIPSGYFLMGDRLNPSELQFVWLGAYFIGATEITNGKFRAFLEDPGGYRLNDNWTQAGREWKKQNVSRASSLLQSADQEFDRFGKEEDPVVEVKWFEANAYAKWLTRRFGAGKWLFSLPSEAQWEKAARGPDGFDYGLSATISDAEVQLYNWKKNPDATVTVVSASAQRFSPNRYGVYHMSGNVSEWTQSEFLPFNRNHPYDEFERNRDDTPEQRVVRGGSWYSASVALLYLPYRDAFQPELSSPERGFRIVATRLPG